MQGEAGTVLVPNQVSAPESPYSYAIDSSVAKSRAWRLAWSVISLDWKLFLRAVRKEGGQNLLVAFLAAAILLNLCSSAIDLGKLLRAASPENGGPSASRILLLMAWAAAGSAFAFSFLSGHVSVGQRISEALRLCGRRRKDQIAATAVRYLCGRQALVMLGVLAPVTCFLAAWLPAGRSLLVAAGLFVLLAACSGVASVIGYLSVRARSVLFVLSALVAASLLAPSLRPIAIDGLGLLPPRLIPFLIQPSPAIVALALGLLAVFLVLVLGLEVFLSLRHEPLEGSGALGGIHLGLGRAMIPLLASRHALAASFGRELLYALRWRRLLGFWLLGTGLFVAIATKLPPGGPLLPAAGLSLLPPLFLSAFFSNLFGADGAGYQSYWILPLRPANVMAAKVLALWTLALASLFLGWGSMLLTGAVELRPAPLFYIACAAISFTIWLAAAGRVTSVIFPRGVDPRRISGDYLSPTATLVTGLACTLFLAFSAGAAMLFDSRRIGEAGLCLAGALLLLAAVVFHVLTSRAAVRLMRSRREEILGSLLVS